MKFNIKNSVVALALTTIGLCAADLNLNNNTNLLNTDKGITTITETPNASVVTPSPTVTETAPITTITPETTTITPLKIETPPAAQLKSEDVAKKVDEIQRPEGTAGGPNIPVQPAPEHTNIPAINRGAQLDNAAPRFEEAPLEEEIIIEFDNADVQE